MTELKKTPEIFNQGAKDSGGCRRGTLQEGDTAGGGVSFHVRN